MHEVTITCFSCYYSLQEKIRVILSLTYQHARNLALLATFYKLVTMMSEKMIGHSSRLVTFISAFTAGYFVFGTNNKLNMQVSIMIVIEIVYFCEITSYFIKKFC